MKDLALHILDVARNGIEAGASSLRILVKEDRYEDQLTIRIADNGRGIPADVLEKVTDPFYTTRTTRRVGMGLPLLEQNAELSGGNLTIDSRVGEGTTVVAIFGMNHIDRPPMGDLPGTIISLMQSDQPVEVHFTYQVDDREYVMDSKVVREVLGGVIDNQSIRLVREMIRENMFDIQNGS
jgi:anti-sigma regulatory factor (Ser/Thr protein kinase)